jgi:hypothetical protein
MAFIALLPVAGGSDAHSPGLGDGWPDGDDMDPSLPISTFLVTTKYVLMVNARFTSVATPERLAEAVASTILEGWKR